MFDFHNLDAYKKARLHYSLYTNLTYPYTKNDFIITNQLRRAALSIILNLAEGAGRYSRADKKHFYTIAKGSINECVAILDILKDNYKLNQNDYNLLYEGFEELSKMTMGLIKVHR